MGKNLDAAKTAAEILKLGAEVYDLVFGKRKDDDKDKKIRELESEIKRLKEEKEKTP